MVSVHVLTSRFIVAVVVWGALVAAVHAQNPEPPLPDEPSSDVAVTSDSGTLATGIQGNGVHGKTRAQVKRELEQAERVGEIKRINRFFGSGS